MPESIVIRTDTRPVHFADPRGGALWLRRHALPGGGSLPLALRNVAPTARTPGAWDIVGTDSADWHTYNGGPFVRPGPLARFPRNHSEG